MAKVAVVYHSGYGHTKVIAEAVVRGVQSIPGTEAQHGMLWVGLGEMVDPGGVNRLSSYLGAMTQAGNVPPEQEPGAADQATGEVLGRRVAKAALRWGKGV